MKKKIILFAVALVMAAGAAVTVTAQGDQDLGGGPTCDYTHCPMGYLNCCSQGGVTLYHL